MNDRPTSDVTSAETGRALLDVAQQAAAARDATGMIKALMASGYMDGIVRRLQQRWPRLPRDDIDDCIAEAVDSAYVAVSGGQLVHQLAGWLWKVADRNAYDRWYKDHEGRRSTANLPDESTEAELDEAQRQGRDALADHRRCEAIRLARRLLPRIGEGQVVAVMELVIETVEAQLPDLSAETVAETLGISAPAARSLMSRGLDRLRRVARDEGVEFPDALPGETEAPEEESDA